MDRLLCGASASRVVAIESGWLPRLLRGRLHIYEFETSHFGLTDEVAGYYVCRKTVRPVSERAVDDILAELLSRDVELRVMPSLWKLRDIIIASTLGFSIIRMRNAQPPPEGYRILHPLP